MKRTVFIAAMMLCAVLVQAQSIGPSQVKPGTFQNGVYTYPGTLSPRSIGPNTCYPYFFVNSGSGTNADPFVSSDGTGGIQTCVNLLGTKGGEVSLAPSAFSITTPAVVTYSSIRIKGIAPGFSSGQYAMAVATSGTRLIRTGAGNNVFQLGSQSGEPAGGIRLADMFIFGKGVTLTGDFNADACINFNGNNDQPRIEGVNITNCPVAIEMTAPGKHSDSTIVAGNSLIGNSYGIHKVNGGNLFYGSVHDNSISENEWHGVYLDGNTSDSGMKMFGNTIVRNCRSDACAASTYPSNVFWGIHKGTIFGNKINSAGVCVMGAPGCPSGEWKYNSASELVLISDSNTVSANDISRPDGVLEGVSGIVNYADKNRISANIFDQNETDITNMSSADDTIIDQAGATIADSGKRTVIDGLGKNAGDPDATGDWYEHDKWTGLKIHDTTNDVIWQWTDNIGHRQQLIGQVASPTFQIGSAGSTLTLVKQVPATLTFTALDAAGGANACQEQTFTFTGAGATTAYACFGSPKGSIGTAIGNEGCRISAADTAAIKVCNHYNASQTPSAVEWTVYLIQ
jgi:hypothetical protein